MVGEVSDPEIFAEEDFENDLDEDDVVVPD